MRVVRGVLVGRADGLQQLLTVIGELENGVAIVVHHPDSLRRVVRADEHGVRPPEHLVPLAPPLGDISVGIGDDQTILPKEIDTVLA